MTLPRYFELSNFFRKIPPLNQIFAAYAGYKEEEQPSTEKKNAKGSLSILKSLFS